MTTQRLDTVLVVDDDCDILAQARRVLNSMGVENVVCKASGLEALEFINTTEKMDLAIIDLRMPKVSGGAVAQAILRHPKPEIAETPIAIMCGPTTKEELTLLSELNISHIINKPLIDKIFEENVQNILKDKHDANSAYNQDRKIYAAIAAKKFSEIETLLFPKLKQNPNNPKLLTQYAEYLFAKGEKVKSEQTLTKVLSIDKNFTQALALLAKVYVSCGRYQEAIHILQKAKALSPQNLERLLFLGEMYLGTGENQSAEENFEAALNINPHEERAAYGLARTYATQGRIQDSKQMLSRLKKNDEIAAFFNNKGILLVRAGKYDEGISLYQNALKILDNPDKQFKLMYNIALAYSKAKNYQAAIEWAQKAADNAPPTYLKPKQLIERCQKLCQSPDIPTPSPETPETAPSPPTSSTESVTQTQATTEPPCLLTDEQREFILGGFDSEPKDVSDGEFVMFNNENN